MCSYIKVSRCSFFLIVILITQKVKFFQVFYILYRMALNKKKTLKGAIKALLYAV